MATKRQIALIKKLLEEMDWTPEDIGERIGEEYEAFEQLSVEDASELIDELLLVKREMDDWGQLD